MLPDVVGKDEALDCLVIKKGSAITGGELKAMQKSLELLEEKVDSTSKQYT